MREQLTTDRAEGELDQLPNVILEDGIRGVRMKI